MLNYAKSNIRDMIAYALLIIGLLLLFAEPSYGSTLVGAIFGLYFSSEIFDWISNWQKFVEEKGHTRAIILCGLLLALFKLAPFIFIGAAVAVLLKQLVTDEKAT